MITRTHFRCLAPEGFEYGDRVWLEIGGVATSELETTEDAFPVFWTSEPVSLRTREAVEYRYLRRDSEGATQWTSETRKLSPTGAALTVEDDDGLGRLSVMTQSLTTSPTQGGQPTSPSFGEGESAFKSRLATVRAMASRVPTTGQERVYVASLQLPVSVVRRPASSGGGWEVVAGKSATMSALYQQREAASKTAVGRQIFVGLLWTSGVEVELREQQELRQLLIEHDCVPVFLGKAVKEDFLGFCARTLWPACHGVTPAFDESEWSAYQTANQRFAETMLLSGFREESDVAFVQDYPLMLVATYLARRLARANVAFYLHTPFPITELYRTLPVREELLTGLLSADVVVFQFFEYARPFLISCKRLLNLDHTFELGGLLHVEYCGRKVLIRCSHVCVQPEMAVQRARSLEAQQRASEFAETLGVSDRQVAGHDKVVVGAFDRCDRLAGLPLKLAAIRNFLRAERQRSSPGGPGGRSRVVFLQGLFFPGIDGASEKALLEEVRRTAEAVNAEAGETVLHLVVQQTQTQPEAQTQAQVWVDKYAILRLAQVYLDTSIKDGLNLVPFEFLLARQASGAEGADGVLVVSEFTGCSRVLEGAMKVNPWDVAAVASALEKATFGTSSVAREAQFQEDLKYVESKSLAEWWGDLVDDIRRSRKQEDKLYFTLGFGSKSRILGIDQRLEHLSVETAARAYRLAKNRLILLDNEGTLAADPHSLQAHGTPPSASVLELLRQLASDHQNTVVITSGRSQEQLTAWFGGVAGIGLAAEHGFYLKVPVLTSGQWQCILPSPAIDLSWKTSTLELMRHYVRRTQGTFVENKGSALVWQYRDADPDFGETQARELVSALEDLLRRYSVTVTHGKGYVEVKLNGVNKGAAAAAIATRLANVRGEIDFVLCVGDDRSDEFMFEAINSQFCGEIPEALQRLTSNENTSSLPRKPAKFMSLQDLGFLDDTDEVSEARSSEIGGDTPALEKLIAPEIFTVKVGRTDTKARFYVEDSDAVTRLLEALKKVRDEKPTRTPSSLPRTSTRHKTAPSVRLSDLTESNE